MKAPSDEMAMRPLTEGTKRRTGLEKRLAWELERWAQALVLSDPVPTLRKTRQICPPRQVTEDWPDPAGAVFFTALWMRIYR